ncbi:MAG: hypothetical protein WC515_03450 [Candidatus Omnitrophota bacterium]
MNRDIKLLVIFLSVTSVILLYTTIVLFVLKENERDRKVMLQKRFDEVSMAKAEVESALKELEMANIEMKTNIKAQDEKIGILAQNLEEAKKALARALIKTDEREFEIQNLKRKLEEERAEKEDLLKRLEKVNEDYMNMKFQLDNLLRTKEELEKRAREITEKEGVSLGTIVIKQ